MITMPSVLSRAARTEPARDRLSHELQAGSCAFRSGVAHAHFEDARVYEIRDRNFAGLIAGVEQRVLPVPRAHAFVVPQERANIHSAVPVRGKLPDPVALRSQI